MKGLAKSGNLLVTLSQRALLETSPLTIERAAQDHDATSKVTPQPALPGGLFFMEQLSIE
jgi:hypothetical protein